MLEFFQPKRENIGPMAAGFVLAMVIVHTNVGISLVTFLLAGIVPGTSISIPPTVMLFLYVAAGWLVIFRFSLTQLTQSFVDKQQTQTKTKSVRKRTTTKKRR